MCYKLLSPKDNRNNLFVLLAEMLPSCVNVLFTDKSYSFDLC